MPGRTWLRWMGGWRRHVALGVLVANIGCAGQIQRVSDTSPASSSPHAVLWTEPFETLDLARWHEVALQGHTSYRAVVLDGQRCLEAQSHGAASILINPVYFDPTNYPWLSWQWRVDRLIEREALNQRHGSDASARVYVYFKSRGLPWQKRNLDYVWSAVLPVGTIVTSPFSSASKMIVAESSVSALHQWQSVERNLLEDFHRCFGDRPPEVVAIGLMSDTDSIGGDSLAYFRNLRVGHLPTPPSVDTFPKQ